jgi:hypothetical protein
LSQNVELFYFEENFLSPVTLATNSRPQADFNLDDIEARCERILCPTNIRKAPKKPRAFSVVKRSHCSGKKNNERVNSSGTKCF